MTGSGPSGRFTDGKDPGALRTIGEVANALDIRQHVLRYWEQQFPMLKPLKRSGGRRYYRPEDVALVDRIDRLVNREGYTLRGARQALEADTAGTPVTGAPVAPPKVAAVDLLPQLHAIRARLAQALQA
ncbi:MAG TPA: MerR family transcriptional regulator [Croceibacterium sp.]|nr:MerR family transcriptional regulator [Croceibacterium sp.]